MILKSAYSNDKSLIINERCDVFQTQKFDNFLPAFTLYLTAIIGQE
ncbi:hypothetical protein M997_1771 [Proteus hauseri ATCC 700826]|uniref:Uncharacterized protein n=1 Tax=Proteus hauseri ATCC 700826 TaxID=1354271 RepID=A0AAJ3LTX4_PROHU|nr:hypothetical protein M997_1771 [Proteus hauseri ATCC 700826]